MKTTVHLTQTELLSILSRHLGGKVDKVVISKSPKVTYVSLAERIIDWMERQLNVRNLSGQSFNTQKIGAIKALRQFAYDNRSEGGVSELGLADSKWAIENWDRWISFVKEQHRFPTIYCLGSNDTELS